MAVPSAPSESPTQLVYPRAHKSALGFAFGLFVGLGIFLVTALHVVTRIEGLPLGLLRQYFAGYSVTWTGAFVGFAWGLVVGFVAGWLLGFVHNFTVGLWLFVIRTKQDLKQTRNFLDHI